MADVVPRRMLDLCQDLLRRALAQLTYDRKGRQVTTLRDAIEHFRNGLANEVDELEDELIAKREELHKAEDVLGALDDDNGDGHDGRVQESLPKPRPKGKPKPKPPQREKAAMTTIPNPEEDPKPEADPTAIDPDENEQEEPGEQPLQDGDVLNPEEAAADETVDDKEADDAGEAFPPPARGVEISPTLIERSASVEAGRSFTL